MVVVGVMLIAAIVLLPMALMVWMAIFWVRMLIEVVTTPDLHYRATGTEKTSWVLLVIFLGWLGAFIYKITVRPKVNWYALGR